jgi:hypothetical protein
MKLQIATNGVLMSLSIVLLLSTAFGGTAAGKSPADAMAIKGYDSVAYFKESNAIKGSESFTFP